MRPGPHHPQGPVCGVRHPGGPGGEALRRRLPGTDGKGRAGGGGGRAGPGGGHHRPDPAGFFAFAEAGLPLLELRPRTASLEEVFLDLTDDNDTVAARAAALFQTSVETAEKEAVGDESDL